LAGWLAGGLAGCLVAWLLGWLVGWLDSAWPQLFDLVGTVGILMSKPDNQPEQALFLPSTDQPINQAIVVPVVWGPSQSDTVKLGGLATQTNQSTNQTNQPTDQPSKPAERV
jgi:hypothetical protein